MKIIFWLCLFGLIYIYQGYLWLLKVLYWLRKPQPVQHAAVPAIPTVTVLLTVCNEEQKVERRIRNILDCDFPREKLEILIASDGSTDQTEEIVTNLSKIYPVRLLCTGERLGKTGAQNRAISTVRSEIIVFTDADTTFHKDFILEICKTFNNAKVGMVTGQLLFSKSGNTVSESQGFYWGYELKLRYFESELGILAVGSGQCMAVKTALLKTMELFVGEDCVVPLDVVLQNQRVIHCKSAIAFDQLESDPKREFKTRVRMTLRNWVGTWSRGTLLNPAVHPGYAFALLSHKILRWLSPFFLLGCAMSLCLLLNERIYTALFACMMLLVAMSAAGWMGEKFGKNIPLASHGFGFLLANAGFFVGVVKAMTGSKIITYRSGELEKQKN